MYFGKPHSSFTGFVAVSSVVSKGNGAGKGEGWSEVLLLLALFFVAFVFVPPPPALDAGGVDGSALDSEGKLRSLSTGAGCDAMTPSKEPATPAGFYASWGPTLA